jgi:hypothetical protein
MRRIAIGWVLSVSWITTGLCGCAVEGSGSEILDNGILGGTGGSAASSGNGGTSGIGSSGNGGTFVPTGGASGVGSVLPMGGSGGTGMPAGGASGMNAGGTGGIAGMSSAGEGGGGAGGAGEGGGGAGGAGAGGMGAAGEGGAAGSVTGGECCPSGDCLCHGSDPTGLTTDRGSFDVDTYENNSGTVYYPTDAEPPFAAVAICPGFLNSGPEMADWGPFYASHGIVMVAVWTIGSDIPDIRAIKLLAAIDELKMENTKSGSPLMGKLAGRYGTSGYSMGGGGTTIATTSDQTLRTSIGLAAWGPVGSGITTPTLFLCGDSDGVAPCFGSQDAYGRIPESTPKMIISIQGATHFSWFGPLDAGRGTSGSYALAFQKVFLEGDERWRPFLLEAPARGTATTNITP